MTWRLAAAALAALAFVVAPAPALAACADVPGNLVANCSFEQPVLPAGSDQAVGPGGDIGGWTVSAGGDAVDFVEHTFFGAFPASDGRQAVDLNRSDPGAVEQRLPTIPGASYRVVFSLSGYPAASANCSGTNPEEVAVSAGAVTQNFTFAPDTTASPPGNQRFEQHQVDFTASGATLLKFRGVNPGCTGPVIDDVAVTQTSAVQPVLGRAMVAVVRSGTILVRLPNSKVFVRMTTPFELPVGTIVDARHGRVRITATSGGRSYSADFYGGLFQIAQLAKRGATADMKLFGGSFPGCPKAARPAAGKKKVRQLWGEGSGPFRTVGRFSAATVRGTTWLTKDTCSGTLTVVKSGSVSVRDFVRHKTIVVRAGKRYLAAARRR